MEVNQITKFTVCQELFEAGLPKSHIADKLGVNRETIMIWLRGIGKFGLGGLNYQHPVLTGHRWLPASSSPNSRPKCAECQGLIFLICSIPLFSIV